ncbi:MAG: alpha/beta hydrolase [Solirubrobacteraceae bacterium]
MTAADPHLGQRLYATGLPLEEARAVMVMVHGRGASAQSILGLADALARPDFAYVAPQASSDTWYPHSFLAPIDQNEPWLSSALGFIDRTLQQLGAAGLGASRVMLLGFSPGACLSLEYAARHAQRFGGIVALTGGLIGPDGTPRDYVGSFEGTPIFIGSSDPDPHIPRRRVDESATVLESMGAVVTKRIYPGMGHSVNEDELNRARVMMDDLLRP